MKNKIISISFSVFLILMLGLNLMSPNKEISITERRKLATAPKLTLNGILSATYMENLSEYIDDQFIFREYFRNIKATMQYDIFHFFDNNQIYLKDNHIFKIENKTNKKAIAEFIQKINSLQNDFTTDNQVYYGLIPDKNYYLDEELVPHLDYEYLYDEITKIKGTKIELRDVLSLDAYYETDTHWRQEKLANVLNRMSEVMNISLEFPNEKQEYFDFYGVLYGQSAKKRKPETLTYLTNESILKANVSYLENKDLHQVYVFDNLTSLDSYNVFLDGASAYLEITNLNNDSGRELVIFRDSFGSSLAPLLIDSYAKITLIDLRYLSYDYYKSLIEWKDQDVLFLYSTSLVNSKGILK